MSSDAVQLAHARAGDIGGEAPPVLILHGLFGSKRNWAGILNELAATRPAIALDLRNHGESPHLARMGFEEMAADVLATADALGFERFSLVGHSLGGKVAMTLARKAPDRLAHLVVVDIAPVAYSDRYTPLVESLRALPNDPGCSRAEIDRALAHQVADPQIRAFLLQNYLRTDAGWRWRLNLDALAKQMPELMDYPAHGPVALEAPATLIAGGPTGLVHGDAHREAFLKTFPQGRIVTLPKAGHWPHVEDPEAFKAALSRALDLH